MLSDFHWTESRDGILGWNSRRTESFVTNSETEFYMGNDKIPQQFARYSFVFFALAVGQDRGLARGQVIRQAGERAYCRTN